MRNTLLPLASNGMFDVFVESKLFTVERFPFAAE
jgi:hypothetical protein